MKRFVILPQVICGSTHFVTFLKSQLLDNGWLECEKTEVADVIFVVEHPRRFSKKLSKLEESKAEKILIRLEPPTVNPILHTQRISKLYDKIINVGSENHKGTSRAWIRWPYLVLPNPAKPSQDSELSSPMDIINSWQTRNRIHGVCAIFSNKVAWTRPSLYPLRRQVALYSDELDIKVFGMDWQKNAIQRLKDNLKLYLFFATQLCFLNPLVIFQNLFFRVQRNIEPIEDKMEILTAYEFTLVIENSTSYVSEKLMDALVAGSIPIYVGSNLTRTGLNGDHVIQVGRSLKDLRDAFRDLDRIDTISMRANIRSFLLSDQGLSSWHPRNVARDIVDLCQSN